MAGYYWVLGQYHELDARQAGESPCPEAETNLLRRQTVPPCVHSGLALTFFLTFFFLHFFSSYFSDEPLLQWNLDKGVQVGGTPELDVARSNRVVLVGPRGQYIRCAVRSSTRMYVSYGAHVQCEAFVRIWKRAKDVAAQIWQRQRRRTPE
ncbi:hypothetical protein GGI42DRAFT_321528 [Trichoderma sp. SZMC 28013]